MKRLTYIFVICRRYDYDDFSKITQIFFFYTAFGLLKSFDFENGTRIFLIFDFFSLFDTRTAYGPERMLRLPMCESDTSIVCLNVYNIISFIIFLKKKLQDCGEGEGVGDVRTPSPPPRSRHTDRNASDNIAAGMRGRYTRVQTAVAI